MSNPNKIFNQLQDQITCTCAHVDQDSTSSVEFRYNEYADDLGSLEDPGGELTPPSMMLTTGFGMRNAESLQRALLDKQRYEAMLRARFAKAHLNDCVSMGGEGSYTDESVTQTSASALDLDEHGGRSLSLAYLMGLTAPEEEGARAAGEPPPPAAAAAEEAEADPTAGMTRAMRAAHRYLRTHRIFEFFKFLTAHLLSAMPENPIDYLLELLEKCLVFRSGCSDPPLLYERPHLGMETLGIRSYDQNPPLAFNGQVCKETFIEEAYDCLTDMLIEMISTRRVPMKVVQVPPPSSVATTLPDEE